LLRNREVLALVERLAPVERREEAAMKIHRVLVEIVLVASVAACVLALLIATLGMAAGSVGMVTPPQAIQNHPAQIVGGRVV
jgi:hypothetical protein